MGPIYDEYLNIRVNRVIMNIMSRLATKWGINKKKRGWKSQVVRLALVYSYLVDVLHVDPKQAPEEAVKYLATEFMRVYGIKLNIR